MMLSALALWSVALCAGAAGSVTIGMQLEPPVLDPTANPAAAISQALYGNLYEGLVQFAADGKISVAAKQPDFVLQSPTSSVKPL